MPYEPGREKIPGKNNRVGAIHEISQNPHQYGKEAKKTNVSMAGGKIITPDGDFMSVNRKGSGFPAKGSTER